MKDKLFLIKIHQNTTKIINFTIFYESNRHSKFIRKAFKFEIGIQIGQIGILTRKRRHFSYLARHAGIPFSFSDTIAMDTTVFLCHFLGTLGTNTSFIPTNFTRTQITQGTLITQTSSMSHFAPKC